MLKNILIVDDEINIREGLKAALSNENYNIVLTDNADAAMEILEKHDFNIVITDVRLLGTTGFDLLTYIKKNFLNTEVIIITAFGAIEDAVLSIKDGAFDYITKPIDLKKFRIILRNCLMYQELRMQNKGLVEQLKKQGEFKIIGEHSSMKAIFDVIDQIATSDTTVLIQGESGTGKELIASAIHTKSLRADKPFIAVNCGAIPESLLESELFGHEKGSFTGAVSRQIGKIELSNSGTLFLDEISTMSLKSQVNLLRVLEENKLRRVGGNDLISFDTRFLAASNIDLKSMIADGTFREDLYYRLCVVPIKVPSLRERKSDIFLLVEHYLKSFCNKHEREKKEFSEEALELLIKYNWPGNVRELKNVVERLVVTITNNVIEKHHLPDEIRSQKSVEEKTLKDSTVENMEYELIKQTLEKFSGHRDKTAHALGISLRTLQYKIKKFDLK